LIAIDWPSTEGANSIVVLSGCGLDFDPAVPEALQINAIPITATAIVPRVMGHSFDWNRD
jgi:hypothetical protein